MDSLTLQFLLSLLILLIATVFCKHEKEVSGRHPCTRNCETNSTALVCHYTFEVEKYYTMSKACYNCPLSHTDCFRPDCVPADGVERVVTVINRQMPGPGIQVCLGDTVVVDVVNGMIEESTSVHWHGHHQKHTPFMDGVAFITQCPIAPGTTFQYKFTAALPGTHFYHSHTGCQRADGLFGSLVIRQPKSRDMHSSLYDYDLPEHVITVTDWIHKSGGEKFTSHYHSTGNNKPDTLLVNGMGKYREFRMKNGKTVFTPLAKFNVVQGKRYRFRLINAGILYCPIEISVDNHTLIVINSDGGDIQPLYADSLVTVAGERWDFIINANNNVSNYWIKLKGTKDCDEHWNSAYSVAVLHYKGAQNSVPNSAVTYQNTARAGLQVNPVNVGSGTDNFITVAEMTNDVFGQDPALKPVPDVALTLSFDFYPIDNSLFAKAGLYGFRQVDPKFRRYIPQINRISMKMPSFPVLTEPEYITNETFCDETQLGNCEKKFCFCTYKIDLPLNAVVEILFIDEGRPYESNHPFHLHGHSFRVVALDKVGNSTTLEEVQKLNKTNQIHRNLQNPPIKDTVTVPDGGFTIVRFYTSNPGYWLLHCHLDFHVETGMAVLLKVGDTKDFPQPPENFPTCGNYYNKKNNSQPVMHEYVSSDKSKWKDSDRYVYLIAEKPSIAEQNAIEKFWAELKSKFTSNTAPVRQIQKKLLLLLLLLSFWR